MSSDARLKKDVQTFDLGFDFINSLRQVSWTSKDQGQGTTQHYGVITQEKESAIANLPRSMCIELKRGESELDSIKGVVLSLGSPECR